MNLTIEVYEADNVTLVDTIDPGQFQSCSGAHIPLGGSGELVLPRTVAGGTANPALALIEDKRLIRFTGDFGSWTMEIEDISDVVCSPSEEAGEQVTVRGRDWLTARAAKVPIHPDAGYDNLPWHHTRWFNFSADRLRDDDPDGPQGVWPLATTTPHDYDGTPNYGRPEGMVNTDPEWIWSEDSSTSVPAGVCYFRHRETFAAGDTYFEFAADDEGELWLDGVPLIRAEGVYKGGCMTARVVLTAGEHLISGFGRNLNALKAGITASWWTVSDGMPDTLIGQLNDTETRVLGYPTDPPGFTPLEVIRLVVDEEQDLGGLPDVGFSFISASDTDSAEVDEVTDLSARAPSSTLLTFLRLLDASYLDIDGRALPGTDAEANPDKCLIDAWIRGTRGSDLSATVILEKGTATLIRHDAKGSERATVVSVSGNTFAPFQVEHADVATLGRYTVPLEFGDDSEATATRWATEFLETAAGARKGISVEIPPGGLVPGDDFDIGDTVGVLERDGTVGDHRVSGWGFTLAADSVVRYSVELDQPSALLEERLDAIMRRFTPGGAGGRTILPSPVDASFPSNQAGSEYESPGWDWKADLGTVQLYKNGVAITGAEVTTVLAVGDTATTTLTDDERKFVKDSDVFTITVGGSTNHSPAYKPTTGRWVQSISATASENDDGTDVTITLMIA